jgi:hypothetical protein
MNEGFFIAVFSDGTERLAFKCDKCKVHFVFAPEQKASVWCCNRLVIYEKPEGLLGFFAGALLRVQMRVPRPREVARRNFEETGTE